MTIEEEYLLKVSSQLKGFKRSNNGYNFRCHICGDSQKSTNKKRAWIHQHNGTWFFGCFNCGAKFPFNKFLKELDEITYKQYLLDKNLFHNEHQMHPEAIKNSNIIDYKSFISNPLVLSCSKMNEGTIYLRKRKLTALNRFFYTSNYGELLKSLKLSKYEAEFDFSEPKILIPHWNRSNQLSLLQMRSMDQNDKIRYRTYRLIEDEPKIWGLELIDLNSKIFITEGAFDASLLKNGIAMSGADMQFGIINNYKDNCYFIMDNEPYNKEITKKYKTLQELGFKVFIWPTDIKEKDINDYWLNHNNLDLFYDESNYFSGLRLKLELAKWIKK